MTLAVTSKTLKLTDVEDMSFTRLAQKISQLPGVGAVSISGGQRPAVRIQFNPRALARYGLNIDDLRTDISNANSNSPKGSFDGATQSSSINANDQISDIDGYRDIVVAYLNGAPVHLSDVANIVVAPENTKLGAWANGTPSLLLNIQRQPGANVIQVADSVKTLLPKVIADMPPALEISILSDRTRPFAHRWPMWNSSSSWRWRWWCWSFSYSCAIYRQPSFPACRCPCRWWAPSA